MFSKAKRFNYDPEPSLAFTPYCATFVARQAISTRKTREELKRWYSTPASSATSNRTPRRCMRNHGPLFTPNDDATTPSPLSVKTPAAVVDPLIDSELFQKKLEEAKTHSDQEIAKLTKQLNDKSSKIRELLDEKIQYEILIEAKNAKIKQLEEKLQDVNLLTKIELQETITEIEKSLREIFHHQQNDAEVILNECEEIREDIVVQSECEKNQLKNLLKEKEIAYDNLKREYDEFVNNYYNPQPSTLVSTPYCPTFAPRQANSSRKTREELTKWYPTPTSSVKSNRTPLRCITNLNHGSLFTPNYDARTPLPLSVEKPAKAVNPLIAIEDIVNQQHETLKKLIEQYRQSDTNANNLENSERFKNIKKIASKSISELMEFINSFQNENERLPEEFRKEDYEALIMFCNNLIETVCPEPLVIEEPRPQTGFRRFRTGVNKKWGKFRRFSVRKWIADLFTKIFGSCFCY